MTSIGRWWLPVPVMLCFEQLTKQVVSGCSVFRQTGAKYSTCEIHTSTVNDCVNFSIVWCETIGFELLMVCFEHFSKQVLVLVSILWCVLKLTGGRYHKIHIGMWFPEFFDSMVQNCRFWASPRRGQTHRPMHAQTKELIINFKLSTLGSCRRTRGTCAQAHETELLESGTQLSVQLPAFPEGFPSHDKVSR